MCIEQAQQLLTVLTHNPQVASLFTAALQKALVIREHDLGRWTRSPCIKAPVTDDYGHGTASSCPVRSVVRGTSHRASIVG